MTHERRTEDPRIAKLVDDVAELQKEMKLNTEVTTQIRDLLRSFKILGSCAKWLTLTSGFATASYHGWKWIAGKL
jgi:hypothetical protein